MLKKKNIEDHLYNKPQQIIELFEKLRAKIFELDKLDKVEENVTNPYIGYKLKITNKRPKLFVEVHIQIKKIELHLRRLDYKQKSGITIKEAPDTHKWTLTKLVDISDESDLDNAIMLIEQSYKDVL
jgi:predicted transport protein